MQNATKKLYKEKQEMTSTSSMERTSPGFLESLGTSVSPNMILLFGWFLFLAMWINWSVYHGQYLLRQTIPAFVIISLVLMLKAMDQKTN